jgi:ATP-dependent RNA helicase DeaD
VRTVAHRHLHDPVEIRIEARTSTVESINQRYWQVSGVRKLDALTRILEVEDGDAMIVFVRTKTATVELAEKLEARGYACAPLNGDMNQALREKAIERLKNGGLDIVVATDVAARGLDVERISHVLNYDIPVDPEAYIHRIGRTGRAGRKGEAILFVAPREMRLLRAIEKATRQPIAPMKLPTHAAVADKRVAQFKDTLTAALEADGLGFFQELIGAYQQEHDVGLSEIAAALAYLVQRERPLLPPAAEPVREAAAAERPARDGGPGRGERDRERRRREPDTGMQSYRIEVGRNHGVEPKHIVGAIANEAGLESRHIGHIKLFDTFSIVDLPEGMPAQVFRHLKKVRVCGQPLNISLDTGAPRRRKAPPSKG